MNIILSVSLIFFLVILFGLLGAAIAYVCYVLYRLLRFREPVIISDFQLGLKKVNYRILIIYLSIITIAVLFLVFKN